MGDHFDRLSGEEESSASRPKLKNNPVLTKLEESLAEKICGGRDFIDAFKEYLKIKSDLEIKDLDPEKLLKIMKELKDFLQKHPVCEPKDLVDLVNILLRSKNHNMITIDDGPNTHTEETLAILEKAGVKAVFYLRGDRIKKHPEIVQKIVQRGHILGYHTMNHEKGDYYSPEVLSKDFKEFDEALKAALGYPYSLIFLRLPYGRDFSYLSYKKLCEENNESFDGTVYLGRGKGTQRPDNWDVQDNKFRDRKWEIKNREAKNKYYSGKYRHHDNQVFLLHQQNDDMEALKAMLGQ